MPQEPTRARQDTAASITRATWHTNGFAVVQLGLGREVREWSRMAALLDGNGRCMSASILAMYLRQIASGSPCATLIIFFPVAPPAAVAASNNVSILYFTSLRTPGTISL